MALRALLRGRFRTGTVEIVTTAYTRLVISQELKQRSKNV